MKYLTNSGLSYFLNKIKAYLTSSTYLNSIGIFPNTDNSVDLGDSSKNIKMIYTEGITINGTQLSSNGITVDSTLDATSSNAVSNSVVSNALDGKSDVGHTHTVSDVTDFPTLATVATSGSYNDLSNKPTTMTPTSHTHGNITNDGKIGSNANKPLITTTGGTVTTGSFGTSANTFCEGNDSRLSDARTPTAHTHTVSDVTDFPSLATVATSGSYNDLSNKPTIPTALESLSTNSIPFHNAYPRCKYLGTSITDAQNTAIKNRTYDDLFIGDYWTINGINWRIVAIDYYYNIGDTNFDKGNIIVMPDTVLYNAQMNNTNTTAGAYYGSLMRTQNLNNARTIAQNAFGSHLANHRIVLANAVDTSGPSSWSWYDSDGVELPNEVQIYGTRVWGSALKGFDVAMQKQQFPLLALAPQFVNIRKTYWLQDVSSGSVSTGFADVGSDGNADYGGASNSRGVRPSVTLSYI